jgi:hypothetical protein
VHCTNSNREPFESEEVLFIEAWRDRWNSREMKNACIILVGNTEAITGNLKNLVVDRRIILQWIQKIQHVRV